MKNRIIHAGCGGRVATVGRDIQCQQCLRLIRDPQELAPRGGWTPTPKRQTRIVRVPQIGVVLE